MKSLPVNTTLFKCFRFIIKDKEKFFTIAQRGTIVNELLLRTRYEEARDKFGKWVGEPGGSR